MRESIVWIHEDALRSNHPAYQGLDLQVHGFFVWDEAYLRKANYGMKRLVFIYETLCEMGVPIYRGDTEEVVTALIHKNQAQRLFVANTPNPELLHLIEVLSNHVSVVTTDDEPFVSFDREPKLKRFFGYWKKAKPILLRE